MPKFLVQNLSSKPLVVAVEPWAGVETLAPEARVTFDYDETGEISVAMMDDGSLCVGVVSERISWVADGVEASYGP